MTISTSADRRHDNRRSERFRPVRVSRHEAAEHLSEGPRLVGRHGESSWLDVHARPGGIVAVCGIGGIGKTTLVAQWVGRQRAIAPQLFVATVLASAHATNDLHGAIDRARSADEALLWIEDAHALSETDAATIIVASHELPHLTVIMTSRHTAVPATDVLQLTHLPQAAASHLFAASLPLDSLAPASAYVDAGVVDACCGWPLMLRVAAAAARALPPRDLAEAVTKDACRISDGGAVADALAFGAGRLSQADHALLLALAYLDEDVTRDTVASLARFAAPTARSGIDGQLVGLVRDGWLIPLVASGFDVTPRYRLIPAGKAWLRSVASAVPTESAARDDVTTPSAEVVARAAVQRHRRAMQTARLKDSLKGAAELMAAGELAPARIAIQRVLVETKRRPEALRRIGTKAGTLEARLLLDEDLPALADRALEAIRAEGVVTADLEGLSGLVALRTGRVSDAIAGLTRATELAPASAEWRLWLGLVALSVDDRALVEATTKSLVAIADKCACARARRRIWSFIAVLWAATQRAGVSLALAEADSHPQNRPDSPEVALFMRFGALTADPDTNDNMRCRRLQDARERIMKAPAPTSLARFFRDWAAEHLAGRIATVVAHRRLFVASDGTWFRGADGVEVELGRKPVLRRLLLALARRQSVDAASPCTSLPIDQDALIGEVWPGERIIPRAARSRLHVAICALRKAGLDGAIARRGTGYALDAQVSWVDVG